MKYGVNILILSVMLITIDVSLEILPNLKIMTLADFYVRLQKLLGYYEYVDKEAG